jgi:hypothetical protein
VKNFMRSFRRALFAQQKHPKDVNDYYHILNRSNILAVVYWQKYFEMIANVKGDIVECGVGRGRSLMIILAILMMDRLFRDSSHHDRKVFALDSFEGFPEPTAEDLSIRNPYKGEWACSPNNSFTYSENSLIKVLTLAGLFPVDSEKVSLDNSLFDSSNLVIVRGYFDTTTTDLPVDRIALLHLDGDLYNSLKAPLTNLWQKIEVGGIVVIDDYYLNLDEYPEGKETFPGARLAVEEFISHNKNFKLMESIRGTPYLVKISC